MSMSRKYGDTSTPNRQNRSSTYTEVNPGPYIGIVKDNVDPGKMGGLRVLIPSLAGVNEGYAGQLYDVQYLMPFYGSKSVQALAGSAETKDISKYEDGSHSYGMWMVPPDIDSRVMVIFVEGKVSQGFWFGCVQEPLTNHMIPGIAASRDTVGQQDSENSTQDLKKDTYGTEIVPAAEVNRNMFEQANKSGSTDRLRKAIHPFANTLRDQGLSQDAVRGTTTSSARRESPSAVFGISTPGRTDPEGRKAKLGPIDAQEDVPVVRSAGHTFVMDDGDAEGESQLIRLRTSSGHQLLMHDSAGVMYLGNATGTVWMEFSNNGSVDIYAQKGYNIRSGGNIDFHAEGDINMYANNNIRIKANENLGEDPMDRWNKGIVSIDGSVINNIASLQMNTTVQKGYYSLRTGGSIYTQAAQGNQIHQASGQVHLVGSQVHFNSMGVDPNLLQPLKRTNFMQPYGTGTEEVQVADVTPLLRGSVGVLTTDRSITGMSGMRVPTHEPFRFHYDKITPFTSMGKREDANKPGTLGWLEQRNRRSPILTVRLGQFQADLEKYIKNTVASTTDIAAIQKATAEFTQNYSKIFNLSDLGPLAVNPLLPGIGDVTNQVVQRLTGQAGGEVGKLFSDQIFVNQAGVLYTLGNMDQVITNLTNISPQGIVKTLTDTAINQAKSTVGDVLRNVVKDQSRDAANSIFNDSNMSAIKDFFRGDGIKTASIYDDYQNAFLDPSRSAGDASFTDYGDALYSSFAPGPGSLDTVFGGRPLVSGFPGLTGNLSALGDRASSLFTGGRGMLAGDASFTDYGDASLSSFVDSNTFGGGTRDLFKNADSIFGESLGTFGNNFISGMDLGNLSARGILQGIGNAAIRTGITIVQDQFRNIIAGNITSLTNITSLVEQGVQTIIGSGGAVVNQILSGGGNILGEMASNIGNIFDGLNLNDFFAGMDIGSIVNFDLASLVGGVGEFVTAGLGGLISTVGGFLS